ncbi:Chaperone protein DnaJ [Morus notabilis]|uniref:Chaperone protein DnaJ n=1 Tax=Morus notabilis TaxID=981085 RepID=W9QEW3_9ROSA|nr:Chaperone protein DnaJ [Morus notabilis]
MQALLLVGPTTTTTPISSRSRHRRWTPLIVAAAAAAASSSSSSQNHYAVLGLNLSATPADIKRAYRLLARKYHPDVSKDSQAPEVFKSIRLAYEVLSNETTRARYDQALKFREYTGRQYRRQRNDNPEFDSGPRIYRWDELRQRMQHEGYWEHNNSKEESSSFTKTKGASQGENQTFGSRLSLTFSSLMALFDRKLDAGYKMGYVIAWILGGRAGILLTLCLTFASWACGKTSSSIVALVVVAMWVGTNLARFAPLPQGALLTLLYMSIKLQVDLN